MPIEIKELVIKTTVTTSKSDNSDSSKKESKSTLDDDLDEKLNSFKKKILAECIENVSRLMKQRTER